VEIVNIYAIYQISKPEISEILLYSINIVIYQSEHKKQSQRIGHLADFSFSITKLIPVAHPYIIPSAKHNKK